MFNTLTHTITLPTILCLLLLFMPTIHLAQISPWYQIGNDIDGKSVGDEFGWSVKMNADGSTFVAGAIYNSSAGYEAGRIRVFRWNGIYWQKKGKNINGEAARDLWGMKVAISADGNTIAATAPYNDGNGSNSGQTRIFSWDGSSWVQKGSTLYGESSGDNAGWSLSMSSDGNTVAIGTPNNSKNSWTYASGHVRVYQWNGSVWSQKGSDINGDGDFDGLGQSVALSADGNTVMAGAIDNATGGSSIMGAMGYARVYQWSGTAWVQKGNTLTSVNTDDGFGLRVSMDSIGNTVCVAMPYIGSGNNTNGTVRVYNWTGTAWAQMGGDIVGDSVGDGVTAVEMSLDGTRLAIGSPLYQSRTGYVRVFHWSGGAWIKGMNDIYGEAVNDRAGASIGINRDLTKIAVGASAHDGAGNDAGDVRVFSSATVTHIAEKDWNHTLSYYPNPTHQSLRIDLGAVYPDVSLRVRNVFGQIVREGDYQSSRYLDVEIMEPKGLYILEIQTPDGESAQMKVMKN